MYSLIYKYLVINKKVSVPGVGMLQIANQSAIIDHANNTITPPQEKIQFSSETALADKSFFKFVAKELNINEVDAIKGFHDFAYQLKNDIGHSDGALLPGIGKLVKQVSGEIGLENTVAATNFFQPLTVPDITEIPVDNFTPTIAEENIDEETTTVDTPISPSFTSTTITEEVFEEEAAPPKLERWIIYAGVLAIVGIAAILYYYYGQNS